MKRRDFSLQLAVAGLGLTVAGTAAHAQAGVPVEGQQYQRLGTVAQTNLPAGKKVEVIEFFSYACPHCFAFEPVLEPWVRQLPADVYFHPVPVGFIGPQFQKMFYALEEIGQREAMHRKLFNAIHVQHARLNTDSDISAFLVANGVDAARFSDAMKSFAVNTKFNRGQTLARDYKVNSVPMVGVQGRYVAEGAVEGSHERALPVFDYLIQRARTGA